MDLEFAENLRRQLLTSLEKFSGKEAEELKEHIKKATPEELQEIIKSLQGQGECLFCRIIKGEIETIKIFEDKDLIAVLDIAPATRGHTLIIPKEHVTFIQDLKPELLSKLFHFVKLLCPVLVDVLKARAISIYIPQGYLAGQNVPHFFINLIPRYENDKVHIGWEKKQKSKKELEEIAEAIRKEASSRVVKSLEEEKEKLLKHKKVKEQEEAEKIYKQIKRRRV